MRQRGQKHEKSKADRQEAAGELEKQEAGSAEKQDTQAAKKKSIKKEIASYLWTIAIACVAAMLLSRFVLINAKIPSESMENLLTKKDRLFGCRLSYVFHGPERYDIVMFKYPVNEERIYIKRVIGLPGETVEIREAKIYIDGASEPIEENYLPEEWTEANDGFVFEVPEDCYLMLGDNRNDSADARYWPGYAVEQGKADNAQEAQEYAYVHIDKIIGRAIFKYYPKFQLFLNI